MGVADTTSILSAKPDRPWKGEDKCFHELLQAVYWQYSHVLLGKKFKDFERLMWINIRMVRCPYPIKLQSRVILQSSSRISREGLFKMMESKPVHNFVLSLDELFECHWRMHNPDKWRIFSHCLPLHLSIHYIHLQTLQMLIPSLHLNAYAFFVLKLLFILYLNTYVFFCT